MCYRYRVDATGETRTTVRRWTGREGSSATHRRGSYKCGDFRRTPAESYLITGQTTLPVTRVRGESNRTSTRNNIILLFFVCHYYFNYYLNCYERHSNTERNVTLCVLLERSIIDATWVHDKNDNADDVIIDLTFLSYRASTDRVPLFTVPSVEAVANVTYVSLSTRK